MKKQLSILFLFVSFFSFCQDKYVQFFNYLEQKEYIRLVDENVFKKYSSTYPVGKGELYTAVRYKTPADDSYAKKIVRSINGENWPKWLKNLNDRGVGFAKTLIGVRLPRIWASGNPVYVFFPHLNKHLPTDLQFSEPFFIPISSGYSYDEITEKEINNKYSVSEMLIFETISFIKKYPKRVAFPLDFEKNPFYENNLVKGKGANADVYFKYERLNPYEANFFALDTQFRPDYLSYISKETNMPINFQYGRNDELKNLEAYSFLTVVVGYQYNKELGRLELIITDYIYVPANTNAEKNKDFGFLPNRDIYFKIVGYYPLNTDKISKELFANLQIDKNYTNTQPYYFRNNSFEDKMSFAIRNFTNRWQDIVEKKEWKPSNDLLKKNVELANNISLFVQDAVFKNPKTEKYFYASVFTKPNLSYYKAKEMVDDLAYFIITSHLFGGIKGFENATPKFGNSTDYSFTGQVGDEKGYYIREYDLTSDANYNSGDYNRELMNIFCNNFTVRLRVKKQNPKDENYEVQILFVEK